MEAKFYGLTRRDIRTMAYLLADRNNMDNPFKKQIAGRSWLDGFLNRHKEIISIRKPTGTSFARALGFNSENVSRFYENLEHEYIKHNFSPQRIFNVDETGLSIVQSKTPEVIGRRGKRQIAAITSAERGSLVTLVACMSAGGQFIPPMLIYPRKNRNDLLLRGAPPGTIYAVHPSGWIQQNLFTEWFRHFINCVKPSQDDPALLILDGHYSHTRNVDVIILARENHVSIVSLPPHSTHKMQPLDKTFMGPLKIYYSEEIRNWIRVNQRAVSVFEISELLGKAFIKSQTAEIAINGFRVTGIWPYNRHIFSKCDFIAEEFDAVKRCTDSLKDSPQPGCSRDIHDQSDCPGNMDSQPGCSRDIPAQSSCSDNLNPEPGGSKYDKTKLVSPFDISPLPALKKNVRGRGKKSSKSEIITSSPYKTDLEMSMAKIQTNNKTGKKNVFGKDIAKSPAKPKRKRKKVVESSDSENEEDAEFTPADEDNDPEQFDTRPTQDDAACIYCESLFSADTRGELWVCCLMCQLWAHEACADTERGDYICDFCK